MDPLPPLPPTSRLSPRVIRILGDNPSKFTLQGSNTYLVGNGPRRILVDTGHGRPAWRERLRETLEREAATVEKVLLTHWHADHVGGVEDVKELNSGVEVYKCRQQTAEEDGDGGETMGIRDGQVFRTEGAELRAVFSPGHTDDHMAFVMDGNDGEFEDAGAMFTGDNVLGHGTAVFEDLATYVRSLERMRGEYGDGKAKRKAYPGHGEVIGDGKAKIVEYIEHRRQRESEIVGVLQGEAPGGKDGWGSMEIVKVVYKNYPENLHVPAEGGVKQVLAKLESEGRAKKTSERWSLTEKAKAAL